MSKKIVITQMPYRENSLMASALLENGRIIELRLSPEQSALALGDIYVGKVERTAKELNAAFIRLAEGQMCFLPLKECTAPIYRQPGRKGEPKPGDELLVQISREALKEKLPSVTANLSFCGTYLVVTTGVTRLGISSKLDKIQKEHLRKLLEPVKEDSLGLIARTEAGQACDQEILEEYDRLRRECLRVLQYGITRSCFSCVRKDSPEWKKLLRQVSAQELEEIVTDQEEVYTELLEYLKLYHTSSPNAARMYDDPLLPLYKLYRLEKTLEEALSEKVWLKSGGFLMIQQTEAFTAVDVNSGKNVGGKNAEALYRKINLEAAQEIAVQLRLRQLSGIILIDFINMKSEKDREELMSLLAGCLKKDPSQAVVVDMTKLQIVEVTRKKTRKSLKELLTEQSAGSRKETIPS